MVKNYAVVTPFAVATCGEISVAVKAIEGGRFSRYAREHIRRGMTLEVMVPQGHFGYQPQAERRGPLSGYCSRIGYYANAGDYRHHFTNRA